jgi:hypothetical protein
LDRLLLKITDFVIELLVSQFRVRGERERERKRDRERERERERERAKFFFFNRTAFRIL